MLYLVVSDQLRYDPVMEDVNITPFRWTDNSLVAFSSLKFPEGRDKAHSIVQLMNPMEFQRKLGIFIWTLVDSSAMALVTGCNG